AEGARFAEVVNEFTELIKNLGPSKVDPLKIKAAAEEASDFRVRWLVGREKDLIEEGNVFGEEIDKKALENLMNSVIDTQFVRSSILTALEDNPLSVKELSEQLQIPADVVMKNLIQLTRGQRVQMIESHPIRYEVRI
ncbi:MAG: hypothetical protein PVG65_02460, partial [Candidatus Thorarchaeota archaeon]